MSRSRISDDLRALVHQRASGRCEYCLLPESAALVRHQVDHILPEKHGGPTRPENLALSCTLCNQRKGSDVAAPDPESGVIVSLFHPRREHWTEHFRLSGATIEGLTATGRATVWGLQLNTEFRLAARLPLARRRQLRVPKPGRAGPPRGEVP